MGYAKYLEDIGQEERISEVDDAKDVLRRFLTYAVHKIRDQGEEIRSLRGELDHQRQHYALATKRHAEVRERKDNAIKSLQTKIKGIMTVRNRRH
jgi:hypothetical protein